MHETLGNGYVTDPVGSQRIYDDENPPTRPATQLRHQEANSFQEEIANVIRATGAALNSPSETIQQMNQLNTAIDAKDTVVANNAAANLATEQAARIAGDANLQAQINGLVAMRGFISGFNYSAERIGAVTAPVYGGYQIAVSPGICTAQNNPAYFITNNGTFLKKILDETTGAFVPFAAGSNLGCVDPNYTGFLRQFTGDTTDTDPEISDIADTTNLYPGDTLYASDNDVFKNRNFRRIISKTATTVTMDQPAEKSVNNVTLTAQGRWYYVFALGKTSDQNAFDIGINPVNDASYFVTQGWDLYRRIGSVLIDITYDTNCTGVPLYSFEGELYYDRWGGRGPSGQGSNYIATTGDHIFTLDIPSLIPLKVDLQIQMHFGFESTDGVYSYRIRPVPTSGWSANKQGSQFYIYTKQFVISSGQAGYQTLFPTFLLPAGAGVDLQLTGGSVNTAHTALMIVQGFKDFRNDV